MDQQIMHPLERVRHLDPGARSASAIACKICKGRAPFFDVVDFNKCSILHEPYPFGPSQVEVQYHRCDNCQFTFTTFFDGWDGSQFRRYIYNDSYIQVDPEYTEIRPARTAWELVSMLQGSEDKRILDFGSGSGVLAAILRQKGFASVTEYDPFSSPDRPDGTFDIITCFETIEHVPEPVAFISDLKSLLRDGGCIMIGTSLQPEDFNTLRCSWWYVAPRNGHVSIFGQRSLEELAGTQGLVVHRHNAPLVLTGPELNPDVARILEYIEDPPPPPPPPPEPPDPEEPEPAIIRTSVAKELGATLEAVNRLAVAAWASLVWRARAAIRGHGR
jgi:SAM-dependent methyltransferase